MFSGYNFFSLTENALNSKPNKYLKGVESACTLLFMVHSKCHILRTITLK